MSNNVVTKEVLITLHRGKREMRYVYIGFLSEEMWIRKIKNMLKRNREGERVNLFKRYYKLDKLDHNLV